jgi:hypothetical protein
VNKLRFAMQFEASMWRSLFRLLLRRGPFDVPPGAAAFGHTKAAKPFLITFLALSVFEIPLFHFIIPWPVVRIVLLVISGYGLIWMFGLIGSMTLRPHVLDDRGLRIRNGLTLDITIPWSQVESVRARDRSSPPGGTVQSEDGILTLGSVQTNVDVLLREPRSFGLPRKKPVDPITQVRIVADDGPALAAEAQRRLASVAGRDLAGDR